MSEFAYTVFSFLLMVAGWALLALTQERHRDHVPGNPPLTSMRLLGAIFIASGVALCLAAQGWGFGIIMAFLLATAAAVAVTMALAWLPQRR